jgi:hypothetical protein
MPVVRTGDSLRPPFGPLTWVPLAVAVLLAALLGVTSAREQGVRASDGIFRLKAELKGSASLRWAVQDCELEQGLTGTVISARVTNLVSGSVAIPNFYVELLDARGWVCGTALLSGRCAYGEHTDPFRTGEQRVAHSGTGYLFPASNPVAVRFWLVDASTDRLARTFAARRPPMWSPAVLQPRSFSAEDQRWSRLWLDGKSVKKGTGPIRDLLVAEVEVNRDGHITAVTVARAISENAKAWFLEFMQHRTFSPARSEGEPVPSKALILVRAVVSLHCLRQKAAVPSASPLVLSYLRQLEGGRVEPVTLVLLEPTTPDFLFESALRAGFFSDGGVGAAWTDPSDCQQRNVISAPGPMLRKIIPPAAAETCP